MQIGFNNSVTYRGKTFHIQTEDRGMSAAQIETQIFCAGAILDTGIFSYQKVLDGEPDGDAQIQKIRTMMQAAHRNFYNKLKAGDYDSMVTGLEGVEDDAGDDDFAPGQDRVPASALDVEQNPEAFAVDPDLGESVDLSKLQEHLAGKLGADESDSSEVEVAATMVATPEQLGRKIAADVIRRPSGPNPTIMLNYPPTGVRAWSGCIAPSEDLSLTPLVEAFLAG